MYIYKQIFIVREKKIKGFQIQEMPIYIDKFLPLFSKFIFVYIKRYNTNNKY